MAMHSEVQALSPAPPDIPSASSALAHVDRVEISAKLDTAFGLVANVLARVHLSSGEQEVHRWQTLAPEGVSLADWFECDMVPEWLDMLVMEDGGASTGDHASHTSLVVGESSPKYTSPQMNAHDTDQLHESQLVVGTRQDASNSQELAQLQDKAEPGEHADNMVSLPPPRRAMAQISVVDTNVSLYYDSMLDLPAWNATGLNVPFSVPQHQHKPHTQPVWASSPSSFVSDTWQSSIPPDSCYGDEESVCSSTHDQAWVFDDEDNAQPMGGIASTATNGRRVSYNGRQNHRSSRSRSPSVGSVGYQQPSRVMSSPMMRALSLPSPGTASALTARSTAFTPKRSATGATLSSFALPPLYPFAQRTRQRSASATSLVAATGGSSGSTPTSVAGSPPPCGVFRRSPSAHLLSGVKPLTSDAVSPESPAYHRLGNENRTPSQGGDTSSSPILRTEALLEALCRRARRVRTKERLSRCMEAWRSFTLLPTPTGDKTNPDQHVASDVDLGQGGITVVDGGGRDAAVASSVKLTQREHKSPLVRDSATTPTPGTQLPRAMQYMPRHASPPIPMSVRPAGAKKCGGSPFASSNPRVLRTMSADDPNVLRRPRHIPVASSRRMGGRVRSGSGSVAVKAVSPQVPGSASPLLRGSVGGHVSRRQQAPGSAGGGGRGGMYHMRVGNGIHSPQAKAMARVQHRRGSSPRMPQNKKQTSPFLVHNRRGPTKGVPLPPAPFRNTMALFQQGFPQDEDVLSAWRKQAVRAVHQSADGVMKP